MFLTIWSALGPLIGVFLGAYIPQRWHRKQWLLDNKKEEYRELLDSLSAARFHLMTKVPLDPETGIPSERHRPSDAEKHAYRVMRDRIFIAQEIEEQKIAEQWEKAAAAFDAQILNSKELSDSYEEVHKTIVRLALASLR
jgi:hypothetical protein